MAFLIPVGLVAKKVIDHRRETGASSMLSSFKTRTDLKNDLFCIQEERDYFEGKFLEQVSELQAVKEDLKQAKKEIRRLRTALMETVEVEQPPQRLHRQHDDDTDDDAQHHIAEEDDASSLTADDELEEVRNRQEDGSFQTTTPSKSKYSDEKANDANEEEEEEDVRKSAAQLLQWASYRSRTSLSTSQRSNGGEVGVTTTKTNPPSPTSGASRQSSRTPSRATARPSLLGKMIATTDSPEDDNDDADQPDVEEEEEDDDAVATEEEDEENDNTNQTSTSKSPIVARI